MSQTTTAGLRAQLGQIQKMVGRRGMPAKISQNRDVLKTIKIGSDAIKAVEEAITGREEPSIVAFLLDTGKNALQTAQNTLDLTAWAWCVEASLRLNEQAEKLFARESFPTWRRYDSALGAAASSFETLVANAMNFQGQPAKFIELVSRAYTARQRVRTEYTRIKDAGGIKMRDVLIARNRPDLANLVDGMDVVEAIHAADELFSAIDGIGQGELRELRRIFPRETAAVPSANGHGKPVSAIGKPVVAVSTN